jgi:hypothetical protein
MDFQTISLILISVTSDFLIFLHDLGHYQSSVNFSVCVCVCVNKNETVTSDISKTNEFVTIKLQRFWRHYELCSRVEKVE